MAMPRQPQSPALSLEQRNLDLALQLLQAQRQGRLRDVEAVGGFLNAVQLRRPIESLKLRNGWSIH